MRDRDLKTITKLLHHMKLINEYMSTIHSVREFENNSLVRDAVVFNLLQIGELSNNHLTDTFKTKHNSIPWINIYGLRNRIVHDYTNVQHVTLYEIIQKDLQTLYKQINQALKVID